jgi:CDP-diacylglycerol--glycerol-3-phosphate 3-phosphatidyltransferase
MLLAVRHPALLMPGMVLMWAVIVFAIVSAISYFGKFWRKVDERIKHRRRRELLMLERKRQRAEMRQRSRGPGGLEGTIWKPPEVN